jgi:hypothetical protein
MLDGQAASSGWYGVGSTTTMYGLYQANKNGGANEHTELRICGAPKPIEKLTTLETKMATDANSHSAVALTFHFYKDDYKTKSQNFKTWTKLHQNTQIFSFPAGDWNKVEIIMDGTDGIGFDVFKLTYDDDVVDVIDKVRTRQIFNS